MSLSSPQRSTRPAATGRSSDGFAFVLHGDYEAASEARRLLLTRDGTVPASVRDDVLLLMTELVSNAVRHADTAADRPVRVELLRRRGSLRVEVVDPGTDSIPVRGQPAPDGSGGWGLFLVDRIADRWGVRRRASGTCVWFEIRIEE